MSFSGMFGFLYFLFPILFDGLLKSISQMKFNLKWFQIFVANILQSHLYIIVSFC